MRPVLTADALLRVTLALVFGFMSLAHGPVMAFAKANGPSAVHDVASGASANYHHHHAAPEALIDDEQLVPHAHEGATTCYSAGCFVAVAPPPLGAPTTLLCVLERLCATPADPLVSAIIDPLVPPPRLQG